MNSPNPEFYREREVEPGIYEDLFRKTGHYRLLTTYMHRNSDCQKFKFLSLSINSFIPSEAPF